MARYRVKGPAAPAFTEPIAPWHPELLTAYAASQLGTGAVRINDNDPPDQHDKLLDLDVRRNPQGERRGVGGTQARHAESPRA